MVSVRRERGTGIGQMSYNWLFFRLLIYSEVQSNEHQQDLPAIVLYEVLQDKMDVVGLRSIGPARNYQRDSLHYPDHNTRTSNSRHTAFGSPQDKKSTHCQAPPRLELPTSRPKIKTSKSSTPRRPWSVYENRAQTNVFIASRRMEGL